MTTACRWSTTRDEQRKKAYLAGLGFSETDIAKLEDLFHELYEARNGAQYGLEVAFNADSYNAALRAAGLDGVVRASDVADAGPDGERAVRLEISGQDGRGTTVVMRQRITGDEAMERRGSFASVEVRNAEGGEGVDATQVVDDLIEIREQSMAGTTFVLGHELAHNLLDVMRRTGTLTPEREAALRERFATKDGAFDEEAFADAFGDRLRRAFVVGQRELAETPDNAVVRLLDALAGWVARIVEAVRRTRGGAVRTPTDAAGAVDALVRETPVGQEVEDGMRRSGVPVDEMKDVGGEQDAGTVRTGSDEGKASEGTASEDGGSGQEGGQQGTVPPSDNVVRDDVQSVPLRADRRRELLAKIAQRRGRKFSIDADTRGNWDEVVSTFVDNYGNLDQAWWTTPKMMFRGAPDVIRYLNHYYPTLFRDETGYDFDERLPFMIAPSTLAKIYGGASGRSVGTLHDHNLTEEDLFRLIDAIDKPLGVVLDNYNERNIALLFFLEMEERVERDDGSVVYAPVMVPIRIVPRFRREGAYYEVSSSYGLDQRRKWDGLFHALQREPDRVLYIDEGRLDKYRTPYGSKRNLNQPTSESGLRRLADSPLKVIAKRRRSADEKGLRAFAPEWGNPSVPSIIDDAGEETQEKSSGRSFSTEAVLPEEDAAYLKAVADGNMEAAGRMVEDAARKAGYTIQGFHGTGQFGFTVFDPKRSDDGTSLFFAGDRELATTYLYKEISDIGASSSDDTSVRNIHETRGGLDLDVNASYPDDAAFIQAVKTEVERRGGRLRVIHLNAGENTYDNKELRRASIGRRIDSVEVDYILVKAPKRHGEWDTFAYASPDSRKRIQEKYNGYKDTLDELQGETAGYIKRDWDAGNDTFGIYGVALRMENPLHVDAEGKPWSAMTFSLLGSNRKTWKTRDIAAYAKKHGYDGVIIENVHDVGANRISGFEDRPRSVYIAFNSNQVKSLDPVTYDDAGGVVPLSERFDAGRQDVRWSTEAVGAPRFSETEAGKRVVARLVDNLIRHQEDLAFGNAAVEGALEQGGNAAVGKWNRVASAGANGSESLPDTAEGLAKEEKFRAFQFGRPGGEELRELVREAGSAENWLDVVGTAYEALSAVRAGNLLGGGLAEQIAKRYERSEREAVGWYVRRIVEARATDYGQKCYLMGREFAMQLMREANESALAELRSEYEDKLSAVRAERREADEARRTAERGRDRARERLRLERARQRFIDADRDLLTRWLLAEAQNEVRATRERERAKAAEAVGEAKAQTREAKKAATAERNRAEAAERALARERETSANVAWQLAEERLLSRYYEAKMKHMMEMKVRTLRDRMRETREQQALKDARKRALERERGMSFAELQGVLGFDLMARVEQAALSEDDVGTLAERIVREIDAGFDKETQQGRKELWEWGTYTGAAVPLRLTKQGERAYAMTAQHILKGLARRLAYGRFRESMLTAADGLGRMGRGTAGAVLEGKIMRSIQLLRAGVHGGVAKAATKRMRAAVADANRALQGEASSARNRFLKQARRIVKDLSRVLADVATAQDIGVRGSKKRDALDREVSRLEAELEKIAEGKDVEDLAKDETLTERQHRDAMTLLFLRKFGNVGVLMTPLETIAKAQEAERFVRDILMEHVSVFSARKEAAARMSACAGRRSATRWTGRCRGLRRNWRKSRRGRTSKTSRRTRR